MTRINREMVRLVCQNPGD
ncbi:hypothetical protein LINGRAHAP2_LOCUS36559 [Linum grandiflorum]